MHSKVSIFDFITHKNPLSDKSYRYVKEESRHLILPPLKIMAVLIAIAGIFAMIFEVRYFSENVVQVYFIRLTATLIAFSFLFALYTNWGTERTLVFL